MDWSNIIIVTLGYIVISVLIAWLLGKCIAKQDCGSHESDYSDLKALEKKARGSWKN